MLDLTNLIGFGAGGVSSLSFVDSASVDNLNITIPATARAGDVAVLFDSPGGSSITMTLPTGFTYIRQDTDVDNVRLQMSYKILTSSDPGASIEGSNGNASDRKIMLVFRADAPISLVSLSSVNFQDAGGGNPSAQNVTATSGRAPLVVLAGYRTENAMNTDSFTPTEDGEVDNGSTLIVKYKIYNAAPADVTVDLGDHGDYNHLTSFYLQVA